MAHHWRELPVVADRAVKHLSTAICTYAQQARSCPFVRAKPLRSHAAIAHAPKTAITVRSKPNVPPVPKAVVSAAACMRSIWIGSELTTRLKHTRKAYRKRSVWVEPLFAEGKDWHGMRRFRLRQLWRVNCEALMRAAGQNLKRLLSKRGWGQRPLPSGAALHFGGIARLFCIGNMQSVFVAGLDGLRFREPSDYY